MILLDSEPIAVPKFISAQKLLEDKFKHEFTSNNEDNKKKIRKTRNQTIELTIGDIACFVKPPSDFVCDTIVRGILPKRHSRLESPTVFVLVTDNKFEFYNITDIADKKYRILDRVLKRIIVRMMFTIHQLVHFLIKDLEKYKSKLLIITGDFFLSDPQITKQDKDWLYPQMIQAIKKSCKLNYSNLFSYKIVRVSKLWIKFDELILQYLLIIK